MAGKERSVSGCSFCGKDAGRYTCPRCCALYCSVKCYQSEGHVKCSEDFYQQCVAEELQSRSKSGDPNAGRRQMEEILRRVHEEDAGAADSDDDPDLEEDLEQRLNGINLNDPEQIWQALSETERRDFEELVNTGEIYKYVPDCQPWWTPDPLVEEIGAQKSKPDPPKIKRPIPSLSAITKVTPHRSVSYGLCNILYAYAVSYRLLVRDQERDPEMGPTILRISACLSRGANFDNDRQAIEYGRTEARDRCSICPQVCSSAEQDVHLLSRNKKHILAALSDVRSILKSIPKQEPGAASARNDKETFMAIKKIDFYLSYVAQE